MIGGNCLVNFLGVRQLHGMHVLNKITLIGTPADTGVKGFFFTDGTLGPAVVIVCGIDHIVIGQTKELLRDRVEQVVGAALLKITAATAAYQQRIASKNHCLIFQHIAHAAIGVPGG